MSEKGFWSRMREARLVRVLLVYLAASWLVLQITALLRNELGLPRWVTPLAVILLLIGFVVVLGTAWVQSRPFTRARSSELPAAWEFDLKGLLRSLTRGRLPHLTWARAIVGGVVAFSLLFGVARGYLYVKERGGRISGVEEATAAPAPGIAVLPFQVVGAGLELWREGMVHVLYANLDGVAGLRAINPRTVFSEWRAEGGEGLEAADPEAALQVARGVGATYAVMGSIVSSERAVRLTAEVFDVRTGELVGRPHVDGSPDTIFALVDRLSMEILQAGLLPEAAELPELSVSRALTGSLPALNAYLRGEQKLRRARAREAIADFAEAAELDSTFAFALYRLALADGWAYSPHYPYRSEHASRAARYAPRLPKREALLLQAHAELSDWRMTAIQTLEKLTNRYPDDVEGWFLLGDAYFHNGGRGLYPRERFRKALRRALELDRSFGPAYPHLIEDAFDRQDSADVRQLIEDLRRIDPGSPEAIGLGLAYALAWGDSATRLQARAALDTAGADALLNAKHATNIAPDFWEQTVQVASAIVRHHLSDRAQAQSGITLAYFVRGRIRDAQASDEAFWSEWQDADVPLGVGSVIHQKYGPSRWLLYRKLAGYDLPEAGPPVLVLAPDSVPEDRFLLGALAASRKRWGEVQSQLRALDLRTQEALSLGDSVFAGRTRATAQALRAYSVLHEGHRETVIQHLEEALRELEDERLVVLGVYVRAVLRYEVGRALLDAGRSREAERYFKSFDIGMFAHYPFVTPVEFHLGQVYEALGEPDTARWHYARFVRWWEDCDPELRPWWEEGRRALERLRSEPMTR